MSTISLPADRLHAREDSHKIYGVVVAIVTDNKDPDGKYRVKVRYPWLPNGSQSGEASGWMRCASMGAGKDRGMFCLPEVQDEVLVAFEHGDIDRGYVLGGLFNSDSTVHLDNKGGENNKRQFKSRSGHTITLDDDAKGKKEQILIKTKAGAQVLVDDSNGAKKIHIVDDSGKNYVTIDSTNNKITIQATDGDMLLKAKNTISIQAKCIETKSDKDTTMKVGGNFEMKASSNFLVKGGGTGEVNSGGVLTVKGSTVNIN